MSGGDRLEVRVRVEDRGAFTVPWNARILYQRVEPGRAERVFPRASIRARPRPVLCWKKVVPKTRFPISETTARKFGMRIRPISESGPRRNSRPGTMQLGRPYPCRIFAPGDTMWCDTGQNNT
jgi:hypothetical protein